MTHDYTKNLIKFHLDVIDDYVRDALDDLVFKIRDYAGGVGANDEQLLHMYEVAFELITFWCDIIRNHGVVPGLPLRNEPVDLDEFEPLTPEAYAERLGEGP